MSPYDMIKQQLASTVPFVGYTGIVIDELGEGTSTCTLEQRHEISNHLGTQHAGALYTLGETASGAAFTGAFADRIMELQPVAAKAEIAYLKLAKGTITAKGLVGEDIAGLKKRLDEEGRIKFPVTVSLTDASGNEVATMRVEWNVKKRGGASS
ncbi:DUF4442 domain-containing protein [Parvularcula maris]|uniref:DUF4442 domain-containing protein n=1 Tax=Parvularcula maris TaxID=2965077 RepID=A0A9X2RLI9_9PROT|nr:DUF4442 domain-containing protein [Parvularcula maris]MCQ8186587.1 DUF4442 domain-containing protein [Parvularcula maris]